MVEQKEKIEADKLVISPSYPSETIEDCLIMVREVVRQKGDADPLSKQKFADAMGKAIPTIVLRLSCCVQYGILKNIHGKGYLPTDLFRRIDMPEYSHERDAYIIEAFKNPSLYKKLIERYNGKILPPENGLENALILDYGINKNSAKNAAKVFFENCKRLKLVDHNNRFRVVSDVQVAPVEEKPTIKRDEKIDEEIIIIPIPLKGSGKRAFLHLPEDYNDADLNRISKFVNALKDGDEEIK